ncbi:DUF2917 domain-containing protein [Xenophilus arseniciresistens]|uniref:DUF2917 domain-containing protein n=1 Tax=Xenophilus arseniciresistens TaxID=1283306 RepID=A0AAE3NAF1_9BURK|nr:DUF2917 domain-containing protein [Xenophilus arseniciresistens]MDA7417758.1 DUF2917 domain-containing protein [Xenophilus arseniciresistens]
MTALNACSTVSASSLALPGRVPAVPAVPPAVRSGAWQLQAGQATTLQARHAHVLHVRQGRLWVTMDATATWGSEDLVLGPGERLTVPAGQRLVMEPWDGFGATWSWDRVA